MYRHRQYKVTRYMYIILLVLYNYTVCAQGIVHVLVIVIFIVYLQEEEEFLNKNSQVHTMHSIITITSHTHLFIIPIQLHVRYHYDAVVTLKRLYIEVKCPSLLVKPPSQEGGNKPGGGTKKGDEKGKKGGKEKKDGGGKGGGKGGAPPAPSHEDVSKDPQADQSEQ